MKDRRIATLLKMFVVLIAALIFLTVLYDEFPIFIQYSLWGQDSFYAGFITNMYNSVVDFLIFSIILFIFLGRHEKNDKIQLYKDNIDDCRFWYAEEASFKNAGNIRRLQELGVKTVDLSKSTLINSKIKRIEITDSKFMGACLDGANFDESIFYRSNFKGVSSKKSSFNNVTFNTCNLKYLNFQESNMQNSIVKECDFTKSTLTGSNFRATVFKDCCFENADMENCNFERADLRGSRGLTSGQLLNCHTIKYAKVDSKIAAEINAVNPKLLRK